LAKAEIQSDKPESGRRRRPAGLEKALAYKFRDRGLLDRALTHASTRATNKPRSDNERLEFLGDRVLGLVIAAALFERFPDSDEGDLARRFNKLVRRETCAAVAGDIGVGAHLILSDSEEESGGRAKATILADACEALLGAVYLEAGFDTARDVVLRLWDNRIGDLDRVRADPKSALQEWSQGRGMPLPEYVEIVRKGPDHAPVFTAEVRITGLPPERGEGPSKRVAEQDAAARLLVREGVWKERGDVH
jgi:ribonuclease-3